MNTLIAAAAALALLAPAGGGSHPYKFPVQTTVGPSDARRTPSRLRLARTPATEAEGHRRFTPPQAIRRRARIRAPRTVAASGPSPRLSAIPAPFSRMFAHGSSEPLSVPSRSTAGSRGKPTARQNPKFRSSRVPS